MGVINKIHNPGPIFIMKEFLGNCIDDTAVRVMESEILQRYPASIALFPLHMYKSVSSPTMMAVDLFYFPNIVLLNLFQSMMIKSKLFC